MTDNLLFPLHYSQAITERIADLLQGETGALETRQFPDGETYLRFLSPLDARRIIFVCTLAHPNDKFLPLLFAASAARDLGATRIGLIAPYLAYMRQDRRFKPGEAVTSRHAAALLSCAFDWLVTVDPHLHRYRSLSEIYAIPTRAVHATPLLSHWIESNVVRPVVVGPDAESEQWVEAAARAANAPFTVLEKTRHGDRDVEVKVRHMERLEGRTPVLIDDIISSGHTMLEAVRRVREFTSETPICLAVHGIFADGSDAALRSEGAQIVTTNTVPHDSNAIDVAELLAKAAMDLA